MEKTIVISSLMVVAICSEFDKVARLAELLQRLLDISFWLKPLTDVKESSTLKPLTEVKESSAIDV